jgi:hypothetical protein
MTSSMRSVRWRTSPALAARQAPVERGSAQLFYFPTHRLSKARYAEYAIKDAIIRKGQT